MNKIVVIELQELLTEIDKRIEILKGVKKEELTHPTPEGFINTEVAAKWFGGVSSETLINWVEKDLIIGYKLPGARGWFFKYSDLQKAVKSKKELVKYRVRL